jgi:hypothetical protein
MIMDEVVPFRVKDFEKLKIDIRNLQFLDESAIHRIGTVEDLKWELDLEMTELAAVCLQVIDQTPKTTNIGELVLAIYAAQIAQLHLKRAAGWTRSNPRPAPTDSILRVLEKLYKNKECSHGVSLAQNCADLGPQADYI